MGSHGSRNGKAGLRTSRWASPRTDQNLLLRQTTQGTIGKRRRRAQARSETSEATRGRGETDPLLVFERLGDKSAWENTNKVRQGKIPTEENIAFNEMVFRSPREGAGDKVDLIHGGHGQCGRGRLPSVKPLEQYDLLWIEEPVAPTINMDEMAKVAAATTIPVATGENLQGLEDFSRLIDKRAASILNLPPPNVGGLTEARKDRHAGGDTGHTNCTTLFQLWTVDLGGNGQPMHGHPQCFDS